MIYHANCADGFGGAFAAHVLLGDKAKYIACGYGNPPPDVKGKNVAIVDFSFKRATLEKMIEDSNSLIVLDHHPTAQEDLEGLEEARFDMNKSGAMLAWEWFHAGYPPPLLLEYIQDGDLWKKEMPDASAFLAAFHRVPKTFPEYYKLLADDAIKKLIDSGKKILAFQEDIIFSIAESAGTLNFFGMSAAIVNCDMQWRSLVGNELARRGYDFVIIWQRMYNRGMTKVSLRSTDGTADVTKIARLFGGGGHKNAASFTLGIREDVEEALRRKEAYLG